MNRLTERDADGNICFVVKSDPEGSYNLEDLVNYGKAEELEAIAEKLNTYEDKDEKGNLVEVVRCKNCLHHGSPVCPLEFAECEYDGNGYCDYGEHKTGGAE